MTIQLYKLSTEEQIDQLKQYFAKNGPTTSLFLAFMLLTGHYPSVDPEAPVYWCSHPDPFNTSDIVVWIIDRGQCRFRFFVSSKVQLDKAKVRPEAVAKARTNEYDSAKEAMFVNTEDEALYRRSLRTLEPILQYFVSQNYKGDQDIEVEDTSLLWMPVLNNIMNVSVDSTGFYFVRNAALPLSPVELPENTVMDRLHKEDVMTVVERNKIHFPAPYVEDGCFMSSCVRVDGNMAGWAMTHREMLVGALHVLPEYRRRGFAEMVLSDLCRQYAEFYKKHFPDMPMSNFYFTACVETFNKVSASFFTKSGWTSYGIGTQWLHGHRK